MSLARSRLSCKALAQYLASRSAQPAKDGILYNTYPPAKKLKIMRQLKYIARSVELKSNMQTVN